MYCSKCGTQNADGSQFCNKCGNNLAPKQPANDALDLQIAEAKRGSWLGLILVVVGIIISFFGYVMSQNALAQQDRADAATSLFPVLLGFTFVLIGAIIGLYNALKHNSLIKKKEGK